jgi:diguanylate cyclase (GGDEF)-like protein
MVFHDVTAAQAMTSKIVHQAQHDILTDLPNRALLNDRTAQAIALAKRHGTQVAMLFVDLDQFKAINDSFGHATGDSLLRSVAQRLLGCVRRSDTVSRQGGDEFVILLTEGAYDRDAAAIAGKILAAMALPHAVQGREMGITSSIGISVFPADGDDPETLIKSADAAMYHAKERGRNNFQFFTEAMNDRTVERQTVEAGLRRALELGEFRLHYQPKIDLGTGAITGAEALLRWSHPEWGPVPPARFIPVAEESGLILPLGRWVLGEACAQARRWVDAGLAFGSIAVNISALELSQKGFVEGLRASLNSAGLEGRYLQLEITESVLMHDAETNGAILRQIKDIGVELAVDDFGTGYSSLSYLTKFPIDVLKIDQSFVGSIELSPLNGIVAGAVIGMGNSLDLRVVAEGIENPAQLAFLKKRHCQEGQGFLFSKAVAPEEFAAILGGGVPLLAA